VKASDSIAIVVRAGELLDVTERIEVERVVGVLMVEAVLMEASVVGPEAIIVL